MVSTRYASAGSPRAEFVVSRKEARASGSLQPKGRARCGTRTATVGSPAPHPTISHEPSITGGDLEELETAKRHSCDNGSIRPRNRRTASLPSRTQKRCVSSARNSIGTASPSALPPRHARRLRHRCLSHHELEIEGAGGRNQRHDAVFLGQRRTRGSVYASWQVQGSPRRCAARRSSGGGSARAPGDPGRAADPSSAPGRPRSGS